jgi:hypothetical protein
VLSREATNTNVIVFVWPDRGSNPRSTTLKASTVTMTPPVQFTKLDSLNYIKSTSFVLTLISHGI